MTMPAITEQEMMEATPDYGVRSLDDYSADELMALNLAVAFAYEHTDKMFQVHLPVWAERISRAHHEAVKRENALPF